jgi:hypothetical protein
MRKKIGEALKKIKQAKPEEQILYLRKRIADLEDDNKGLRVELGRGREIAEAIRAAVVSAKPFNGIKKWDREPHKASATAVILFSDWHIGEVIVKAETEGFGCYDYSIGERRIFEIVDSFIRWVEIQRQSYTIEECVILGIGDYISGDIHRELSVTNEFPAPVQTAKAGLLLGECTRKIAPHFKFVKLYGVGADNHGRLTMKGEFKHKATSNMSFLVHSLCDAYLQSHRNVQVILAPGIKHLVEIQSRRFLVEHGDSVRAWMGIPYYGLERLQGREARRRMRTEMGFDYQVVGHWHVPGIVSRNIIINGSLTGTSEYDHAVGRFAEPSQVAFMVNPNHGVFNWTAFGVK